MDKRVRRIKEEISVILNDKNPIERYHFINEIESYLYVENRKIRDLEIEVSLKEKQQHVYNKKY